MHKELWQSLEGLFAYDTGSIGSGIHDPVLKRRCFDTLDAMTPDQHRLFISRNLRDAYLSEEGLGQGYGYEDVAAFIRWLEDQA